MQTIILSESHDAKPFEEGSIIYEAEFKKAQTWIDKQLEVARQAKQAKEVRKSEQVYSFENQAKTITILGSRGSGKTSFMKSLMEIYKRKGVQLIELIDPTLIEEKGHPFLIILSELDKLVRSKLEEEDASRTKYGASREVSWEKALKKLAEGLPSLDPIGNNYTQWEDAEYVMEKGLRRVSSARTLAESFHELLREALEILKKDAFLIALDDIDIDFLKGWPILETLRRYLQTPLLITLLSGDLRLYSKAIRKQQWKNFGKALLKNEAEALNRISDYDTLVTDMEGQYLQKVLPSVYRIHLGSLQEKRQRPKGISEISVCPTGDTKSGTLTLIEDLYRQHLTNLLGITNRSLQEPYLAFLLGLPLRSQIRLLSSLADTESQDTTPWLDILLAELYVQGVDVDLIRSTPASIPVEMIQYLQRHQLLDRAYQFQPSLQDSMGNAGLFALSATYALHSLQAPYLFFEYLIRIGLPYHLDTNGFLSNENPRMDSSRYFSLDTLVGYALAQNQSLTESCGSITAYIQALGENSDFGILNLPALAQSRRQGDLNSIGRIDYELREVSPLLRSVAYLPVILCREQRKPRPVLSASFYQLLASIGELMKRYKLEVDALADTKDSDKEKEETERRIIRTYLQELGDIRYYLIPSIRSAHPSRSPLEERVELDSDEPIYETKQSQEMALLDDIRCWLNESPKRTFSPQLVGRIVLRLQQGLGKILYRSLGEFMHRSVILFFNALLVEASIEIGINITLNRSNTLTDDRYFRDNLGKFSNQESIPSLVQWILRCPLLLIFLDTKAELKYPEGKSVFPDTISHYSLFEPLSNVLPFTRWVRMNDVDELIDMSSNESFSRNQRALLRYITEKNISIKSPSDLLKLPFVNWGDAKDRIQRRIKFYNLYRSESLRSRQTNSTLVVSEHPLIPDSSIDMSTAPLVRKNKRALYDRIKENGITIKGIEDLDKLVFVTWGMNQNKQKRQSLFLSFYREQLAISEI
nr:AAA family ATPase [uncultured Porphyromonas sp.]